MAEDLAPGQVWRLRDRRVIRIAEVSGDDVNGATPASGQTSSENKVPVESAVWAGCRADFDGAQLIGPLFRVSFVFPAAGPQDSVFAALAKISWNFHRTGARIETGTGTEDQNLSLSEVEWTVDVVAQDEGVAKARVKEALVPYGKVKDGSMSATLIPES